jgi:uncharacterized protein (DUF2252 family)
MTVKPKHLLIALLMGMGVCTGVHAQTSRAAWVVNDVYNYNEPYAATDSADLATKMQLMDSSAFYFFRGTADIFYQDMNTWPASNYVTSETGLTWLPGDAHLDNFGAWEDSQGNYVFGVNDFDEAHLGQYVWDLRRAAVSIVLAGQENGLSNSQITTAIDTFVAAYVSQMNTFAQNNSQATFQLTTKNTSSEVKDLIQDSEGDSQSSFLSKYTSTKNSVRTFQTSSDLITVNSATYTAITNAVASYIQTLAVNNGAAYYTVEDIRQKLGSGCGSLGKLRYWVLIEGPSTSDKDDIILELKQEATSNVALASPSSMPATDYGSNEGERVTISQIGMLENPDPLAGWTTINNAPYYVHQKSPYEEDFDYTQLSSSSKFDTAMTYFGQALASAHARADNTYNASIVPYNIPQQISAVANSAGLQSEIASFAFSYAQQVNLDWQAFVAAYKAGTPLY